MPRLSTIAACDRILHDENSVPSLIGVFSAIRVGSTSGAQLSTNAVSPKPWSVFTLWIIDSEQELGKDYVQRLTVTAPSGKTFGDSSTPLNMERLTHNVRINIELMPIGVVGDMVVEAWLEDRDAKTVTPRYKYTIRIEHTKPGEK